MSPDSRKRASKSTVSSVLVLFAILVVLVYEALTSGSLPFSQTATQMPPAETVPVATGGWYSLYFTQPDSPKASLLRGGPDESFAQAIRQARLSVDVAAYQFNLASLKNALLDAQRRGVTVRMVTDSDYLDEEAVQALIAAGIPVLGDRREGLMHDKFAIIDRQEVWTGSMNYTDNGAYLNDNNLIRIRSTRLAEDYLSEFEEMFVEDFFGPSSPANTPYSSLSINGELLQVYFSPEDGTADHLVELIRGAKQSIYFLAYSYTSDEIALAMIDRAKAGVTVAGVFETSQFRSNTGTEFEHLLSAGVDVRLDGNPRNMHHKVIILDGQTVVTGSYNFSASAEDRNDENTLVIHSPEIAAQFMAEYQRIFAASQAEISQ
ncbi:MAG: phospholipase D-like domain-containing protein [Anaerolineales bacterium]|jgi:phosphatidylserine/phosphatidylglycerophosphate/cardiolipin synthase-like enzyme